MTIVQAPAGASLEYTSTALREAEKVLAEVAGSGIRLLGRRIQLRGQRSEQGLIFAMLKPFDERQGEEHRIQGLLPRLRGPLFGIQSAFVIPFAPPAINGLGAFGGFTLEVLDQRRRRHSELGAATAGLIGASQQSPRGDGASSAHSPPTIHSSPSTSIAKRREASACRSARLPTLCRSTWDRHTSTISTSTIARIASTCRRTSNSDRIPRSSVSTTRAPTAARWCRWRASCACARRRRPR